MNKVLGVIGEIVLCLAIIVGMLQIASYDYELPTRLKIILKSFKEKNNENDIE